MLEKILNEMKMKRNCEEKSLASRTQMELDKSSGVETYSKRLSLMSERISLLEGERNQLELCAGVHSCSIATNA